VIEASAARIKYQQAHDHPHRGASIFRRQTDCDHPLCRLFNATPTICCPAT